MEYGIANLTMQEKATKKTFFITLQKSFIKLNTKKEKSKQTIQTSKLCTHFSPSQANPFMLRAWPMKPRGGYPRILHITGSGETRANTSRMELPRFVHLPSCFCSYFYFWKLFFFFFFPISKIFNNIKTSFLFSSNNPNLPFLWNTLLFMQGRLYCEWASPISSRINFRCNCPTRTVLQTSTLPTNKHS